MFRFKALFSGMLLLSALQSSRAELWHSEPLGGCKSTDPCATTARIDYYHDDCTMDRYQIFTYCDCKTKILYYRITPKAKVPSLPSNFMLLATTADYTTPGGDTGLYVIDSDGTPIALRNPYPGEFEREGQTCTGLD